MDGMDNYFCASCLKFDEATDLFIRKLQRTFHWHVNARAGLPLSGEYASLVDEVEAMDAAAWHEAAEALLARDRKLSNGYLSQVSPGDADGMARWCHYSIRYTEVMAVSSDFVLAEKGDYKNEAARRWKAFREQIDQARAVAAGKGTGGGLPDPCPRTRRFRRCGSPSRPAGCRSGLQPRPWRAPEFISGVFKDGWPRFLEPGLTILV